MTNQEIKSLFISKLYETQDYIKKVNDEEYRIRCPFCGDSQKNLNTGHMYIKANLDDNFPMFYYCFKCNEYGVVNNSFLNAIDMSDTDLKSNLVTLNKTSDNVSSHKFINGDDNIIFDYTLPEIERGDKTKYIEDRLGTKLSDEELKDLKVITSLREFLIHNNIKKITCSNKIAYTIEAKYVGFLTYGGSHILFRDITNTEEYSWLKYPISEESKKCRAFYSIAATVDIFTEEPLIINLAEGVMDIASAYKNLGFNNSNTMNIAVCGKQYHNILVKLLNMGFVGSNIIVNIFADNDEQFNDNKNNKPTDIKYFNTLFKKLKYLYGEVNIYYNTIYKDIGVNKEKISLKRYKI